MESTKTILVTGGLGYIGSHTIVELFNEEYLKANSIIDYIYFSIVFNYIK